MISYGKEGTNYKDPTTKRRLFIENLDYVVLSDWDKLRNVFHIENLGCYEPQFKTTEMSTCSASKPETNNAKIVGRTAHAKASPRNSSFVGWLFNWALWQREYNAQIERKK